MPAGFDAWFARACAREPAERFESPRQLADEFGALQGAAAYISERVQTNSSMVASVEPSATPLERRFAEHTGPALELARRPRSLRYWRLAGAVALLAALAGGIASFRSSPSPEPASYAGAVSPPPPPAPPASPRSAISDSVSSSAPAPTPAADPPVLKQAVSPAESSSAAEGQVAGTADEKSTPKPAPPRPSNPGSKTNAEAKAATQPPLRPKEPARAPVDLGF